MRPARRPLAALLSALLVWLTAASPVHHAQHARPYRNTLFAAEADAFAPVTLAIPRGPAVVARTAPRPPLASHDPPVFAPSPVVRFAAETQAARRAPVVHARARRAPGVASTYDATAPPRTR